MESAVDTGSLGNPDPEAAKNKLAALQAPADATQPAAPMPTAATPAQTGVNPGGQGYVSGQVNPNALAALSAPAAAPAPVPASTGPTVYRGADNANATLGGGGQYYSAVSDLQAQPTATAPVQIGAASPSALTGKIGTTPVASAPAAPAAAPGTTTANPAGTTNGYNPLNSGVIGASGIGGAVNTLTGGLLQTEQADLSGVHAAQNADFGAAQNLAKERYDYTPGAAPSQSGVTLNTGNADQTRAQQQGALAALGDAAAGRVPSAAELQMRAQAAKNNAATLGAARALGGRSAGGVARAATVANAGSNAATNAAGAQLRAGEQATARQQQIAALSGVRSQDVDTAQAQAALDQARNSNNLTAQTTANAQAEAQRQALLQAQLQAMGYGSSAAGAGATASAANAAAQNSAKGGVLKTLGSAFGL